MGQGLQRVLRSFGKMKAIGNNGKTVIHVWDYANNQPRIASEMTKEEVELSNKARIKYHTVNEIDAE